MQELVLEFIRPIISINLCLHGLLKSYLTGSNSITAIISDSGIYFVLIGILATLLFFFPAKQFQTVVYFTLYVLFFNVVLHQLITSENIQYVQKIDSFLYNILQSEFFDKIIDKNNNQCILGYLALAGIASFICFLFKKLFYFIGFIGSVVLIYYSYGPTLKETFNTDNSIAVIGLIVISIFIVFYFCKWSHNTFLLIIASFIGTIFLLTFISSAFDFPENYPEFLKYILGANEIDLSKIQEYLLITMLLAIGTCCSFIFQVNLIK